VSAHAITLITLVITIIVLLILAGITINLTIGEDGIITLSQQSGENYVQVSNNEQSDLEDLTDYLNEKTAAAGEKVKDLTKTTTTEDGVETTVKIGQKISDGTGVTVPVPDGFYYVGGTVASGAVISDNVLDENKYKGQNVVGTDLVGNQYVFIPCTIDGANETLQYKRTIWGGVTGKDEFTLIDSTCSTADDDMDNGITTGVLEKIVAQIKAEMLSIEKYGGYYIGRYEVGKETVTENETTVVKAVVKANVNVYTKIMWSEAYEIATTQISGGNGATSYLCSSYAWDTAINFIQNNGTTNYATSRDGFNENWADMEVKNSAGNVINKFEPSAMLRTGLTTAKSNIFDMGGNFSEFTTELNPNTSRPVIVRGGNSGTDRGGRDPAGVRTNWEADYAVYGLGLRSTLFLN
jgi:hypothetical protein